MGRVFSGVNVTPCRRNETLFISLFIIFLSSRRAIGVRALNASDLLLVLLWEVSYWVLSTSVRPSFLRAPPTHASIVSTPGFASSLTKP